MNNLGILKMETTALLNRLWQNASKRQKTDRKLSTAWCIFPFILGAAIAAVEALFFFGYLDMLTVYTTVGILGILSFVIFVYLLYRLIERRTRHFVREQEFMQDVLAALHSISSSRGVDATYYLAYAEQALSNMRVEEDRKSPAVWSILCIIVPLVSLYVYYFLMRDFYRHERREDEILQGINGALSYCGLNPITVRRAEPIPKRSFILYLILSILTGGIFAIYWLYVLIKDPNNHFTYHEQFENELLNTLWQTAAPAQYPQPQYQPAYQPAYQQPYQPPYQPQPPQQPQVQPTPYPQPPTQPPPQPPAQPVAQPPTQPPTQQVICTYCGEPNPAGARYCKRCGQPLQY